MKYRSSLTIVGLIGATPTILNAAPIESKLCSPFNPTLATNTTCRISEHNSSYNQYGPFRGLTCIPPITNENVDVVMRGVCSHLPSSAAGSYGYMGTLTPASSVQVHRQCWCQMTEPVVSGYVWAATFSDTVECIQTCPDTCAMSMTTTASLRKNIFSYILSH